MTQNILLHKLKYNINIKNTGTIGMFFLIVLGRAIKQLLKLPVKYLKSQQVNACAKGIVLSKPL